MKIKKIIAKEGLILLSIVILGLVIYFIASHFNNVYLIQHQEAKFKIIRSMKYSLVGYVPYIRVMSFGLTVAIFGYPVFVITRFILWALKTIKK